MNQKGNGSPMTRSPIAKVFLFLVLLFAAFTVFSAPLPTSVASPSVETTASKAAFLFNLSRFIEWQDPKASSGDSPIIFAVMEDDSLGPALKQMLESKGLNGQVLVIRDESQVKAAREFFNVFSFDTQNPVTTTRVLKELKGSKVLTVSQAKDFLERGGMVQVEMTGNALQFKVNEEILAAEGLKAAPALRQMAGKNLYIPGKDSRQMYEAWKKIFDKAQAVEGGLPVQSGDDEEISVMGRMKLALKWIAIIAVTTALIVAGRWVRNRRKRQGRRG
jgi:hypothetical protein